jgi:DNA-directed RNA polymerase beta subunit
MSISSKQLIDAFFDQNNGRQKVTHQIESFNYFMSVVVPETLKNAGPLVITGSPDLNLTGKTRAAAGTAGTAIRVSIENNDEVAEAPKSRPREVTVTIEFANVQIRKPTIFENNGAVTPMYPNDARLRNLTYACSLYCDLLATFTMKEWPKSDSEGTGEPIVTTCQRTLPHVHVGRIPVMVGSETCLMSELPEKTPSEFGECSEDVGGYFIIQGGERVIISQERMAENYPFVFRQNKARKKDIEVIDVKSIGPDNEGAPKSFSVKIIRPARFSHGTTNSIVVTCPRIKAPVPLFIMMRALGIPDDRSIVELIIGSDSDAYTSILEESIRNAEGVTTTEGALEWIRLHLGNGSGSRETLTSNTLRPVRSSTPPPIRDILAEECLPHIGGASMEFEKACYIALITRRLLDVNAGILAPDDRDSYTNKKVELPGNLMGNLFRFLFCSKVVKDIKSTITKEIHNGFWKSSGKIMDILNQSNVYKILKSTTISVGMKSALATGNFASGKMGIKAGISQVLNRLTYLSGISHLRRLSTPIEKTGKLLAPRKLHNTQWGFVCPAETPEGHAVGVVKNLASLAVVSLPISAEPVVAFLYDVLKMSELNPKMIPIPAGTRVFVNGAWIGMLYLGSKETVTAITLLRAAKRCGRIHPHTGITFKFHQNEVWINTEGGRLMRPLLFAPAVREILKSKINPFSEREMTWNDLMKWKTLRGHSLIEFVDATETENLFIAMDLENLKLDHDYTHLEIHPATILGAMTSNIPFSDHNQSPRNVYQCLHPDETVRMADGSEKRIADVRIGDEVQVFDPVTLELSLSHVIHQYVRPTDKRIFRLTAAGGRTLTATENHPLMTQRGWVHVGDLKPDTDLLAISLDPEPIKFEIFAEQIIITREDFIKKCEANGIHETMILSHAKSLESLSILPLKSIDRRTQILARIAGLVYSDGSLNVFSKNKIVAGKKYVYSLPQFQAHFSTELGAQRFEEDIKELGFTQVSVRESIRTFNGSTYHTWFVQHNGPLPSLLCALELQLGKKTDNYRLPVPEWIMSGPRIVKREFLAGFQGGDGCKFRANIKKGFVSIACNTTSQQIVPEFVDSLQHFLTQIVTLLKEFEVDAHLLPPKTMKETRIECRFILNGSRENLLTYWRHIGFRFDCYKQNETAIIAEFIRDYGASKIIRPNDLESWRSKCFIKGSAIFVPIYNKVEVENCEVSDITVESDHHSFITSHGIMSSNSAMGKQATGVYALNFRQRMDTMANLIWYSSVPLVNSFMGQYFSKESMSSGYNIIVAIMPYGGYNQEDSLMFNKASLDRGLFSTEFYRTYKDEEKKNQASGEEEKFCKPLPETTRLRQHANYNKLDPATGFVPVNTFVTHEDVLIGKVAPIRLRGVDGAAMAGLNHATLQGMSAVAAAQTVQNAGGKRYKDASKLMRTNESGFVDCIYRGRNGDGFSSVKIRIREHRRPEVGDKFSSRHGQKGTCGLILAPEDMPFTASGIIPDLIINPHCLAEDHEILTEHGFMNWSEVKEGYESGLLRVAGYDHETGHLVYEHPTDFILNERSERDMIEFSHSEEVTNSNGVSLLVTTDHDMFARKGRNYGDGVTWDGVQKGPRGASHRVATDYEKIKAVDLLTADAIKFIGKARSGIITEDIKGPAFIETYKTRNFTAFCELYGYWLGDGTLRFNGNSVEMSPVKAVDNEWLHERFAALELKEGIDFTYNVNGGQSEARPVRYRFSIINREWFNFFCAEYGKKYAKYETSTTAPEVTSVTNPEKIKSAKWMAPWVWNLSANMARSILVGLRFADGCEKANRNIIWTSSSRFRDEIVRLAIHAGYSVNFKIQHNINDVCGHDKEGREIIARHVSWSISYTDTPRGSEPVLNVARDVKKTAYDGRTWCVTMPHGFIITRRAIREDAVVVQASRPIITGQCIPSRMTLAHIMETVVGRACCEGGFMGDGTPFNSKMTAEAVGEELTKRGLHHSSDEVLYCGYTGKQMPTNIFQGPCHYQRLKHMVADKIHSRATGPLVILTRQPAEGRARDGGLRIGEMERDVLIAHGVSLMLKERLLEMSDNFEVHVCKGCGMLGIANFARNIWCCRGCGNKTDFSKLRIPYAYKLFLQELESMSVTSRILTDSRLRQLTN